MIHDRRASVGILLVLASACSTPRDGAPARVATDPWGQRRCAGEENTLAAVDPAHPATFVALHEVTPDGRRIPIFLPDHCVSAAEARERVNAQIGSDSRVEIRFLREKLVRTPTDIDLMVRGSLISEGAEKRLEIRNYSVVGEESTPATARVESSGEIRGLVSGLRSTGEMLRDQLSRIEARTGSALLQRERETRRSLERGREEVARREQESEAALRDLSRLQAEAVPLSDPALADAVLLARRQVVADSIDRLSPVAAEAARRLEEARQAVRQDEARLEDLHTDTTIQRERAAILPETRAQLLAYRRMLEIPLRMLTDPANRPVVSALVSDSTGSVDQVVQLAREVVETWFPALERTTAEDTFAGRLQALLLVERIDHAVDRISRSFTSRSLDSVRGTLVGAVKDTDLLIGETGARAGDVIILTIRNGESTPAQQRDLQLRLRVATFGLTPSLGEAFSLVNRLPRIGPEANQAAVDSMRLRFAARGLTTGLTTRDSVLHIQEPHRWAAGYSFTSGWVYRGRAANPLTTDTELQRRWHDAVAWLQPSFGVQVGLPKFQTRRALFKRQLAITPRPGGEGEAAQADTVVTVGDPEITEVSRGLDVALGGFVGGWNNMVVVGYGWHLTADAPRRYMSVGLSFVRIAQTAIQALSAPQ